jgi:hypothetical protein
MNIEEIKRQAELAIARILADDFEFADDREIAKGLVAANELLQHVVVLEEGAEPMVGDLLISDRGSMGGVSCGYLFSKCWIPPHANYQDLDELATKAYWTITPRFGDGSQINKHWANPKEWRTIIQRNGLPVIYQQVTK